MQGKFIGQIRAAYQRLSNGTTGVLMFLVPGGDRTTVRLMLFSGKIAAGLILLFTFIALLPWTGTGSYVSLTGLICVTLILGGLSLMVGWGYGVLRERNCPVCDRSMGIAIISEHQLPYYYCADCDTEFTIQSVIEPDWEARRVEAHLHINECLHPAAARR